MYSELAEPGVARQIGFVSKAPKSFCHLLDLCKVVYVTVHYLQEIQ